MADPSLFATRWVVGVPAAPLHLSPGASLRLQLTQTEINAAQSAVPRLRVSASSDARWTALAQSPGAGKVSPGWNELEHRLKDMPGVPSCR